MHNGDLAKFVSLQNMCKKVLIDEANISKTVLMTVLFNARKNSRSRMHVKNCKKNCRGSLEISTFQMLLSSASKSVFHIRPMNYVSSFLKDYSQLSFLLYHLSADFVYKLLDVSQQTSPHTM